MIRPAIHSEHRLAREHTSCVHSIEQRIAAVDTCVGGVVTQFTVIVLTTPDQPRIRPLQHQVIAGAAEIVHHERIGDPAESQIHRLTLVQVVKLALDECQAGVVYDC